MLRIIQAVLLLAIVVPNAFAGDGRLLVSCSPRNDVFRLLKANRIQAERYSNPMDAIRSAKAGEAVLLMADEYPAKTLEVGQDLFDLAATKNLRLYVEFPSYLPGLKIGDAKQSAWERLVVSSEEIGTDLPKDTIMMANECLIQTCEATNPLVVSARVAGYDRAVYGIPAAASPVLFSTDNGRILAATTKLSGFVTGRFAPASDWAALWTYILDKLSGAQLPQLHWEPEVAAAYGRDQKLPPDAEANAFRQSAKWVFNSHLLISDATWPKMRELLKELNPNNETAPVSEAGEQIGDGRFGILEGYSSRIDHNGEQMLRRPIRADCQAETAMVLALDWKLNRNRTSRLAASNLLDFLYYRSDMCGGARGNPAHPSFGLIGWGSVAPAWTVANYGDDNARAMLATMLAAACLESDHWDEPLLRALYANLRTTGSMGFRGDRIDIAQLEENGWKHYRNASTVNYSPAFESMSWACYLWAYRQTGDVEFLTTAKKGIQMTMEAFPDKWRWDDSTERARMLLCLAWLVRVEDTAEHRHWLQVMVEDTIRTQHKTGAVPERFRGAKVSHYKIPDSNEAYGTGESPLLQRKGDPVTDQLYNSGFLLVGLREAAAVMRDAHATSAESKLAEYLCRIQIKSKRFPYLNGNWFRAFDFERWEPWASSGDSGWGAWCVEAGWAQAWGAAGLGLRVNESTFWEMTGSSRIKGKLPRVREQMAQNDGGPWKPAAAPKNQ